MSLRKAFCEVSEASLVQNKNFGFCPEQVQKSLEGSKQSRADICFLFRGDCSTEGGGGEESAQVGWKQGNDRLRASLGHVSKRIQIILASELRIYWLGARAAGNLVSRDNRFLDLEVEVGMVGHGGLWVCLRGL